MDLREKRDLMNGFGDGLARAFEIALTPAIFGGFGYGLDRLLGIVPVLTIALLVLSLAGMFARTWYAYDAEMKQHEAAGPWAAAGAATKASPR